MLGLDMNIKTHVKRSKMAIEKTNQKSFNKAIMKLEENPEEQNNNRIKKEKKKQKPPKP